MLGIPEDIHLVLVGKHTNYTNQIDAFIKSHRLEKRVHLLHDVTFQYLPAIYQQAEIFVYPSRFEALEFPLLKLFILLYLSLPPPALVWKKQADQILSTYIQTIRKA